MERVANARPEANPSSRELRRTALRALVESKGFGQVVMAVIVINAITLGLETSERAVAAAGPLLAAIDRAALVFFTMELTLRLWAHRFAFFRGGWNLFDLAVVAEAHGDVPLPPYIRRDPRAPDATERMTVSRSRPAWLISFILIGVPLSALW